LSFGMGGRSLPSGVSGVDSKDSRPQTTTRREDGSNTVYSTQTGGRKVGISVLMIWTPVGVNGYVGLPIWFEAPM